MMFEAGAKEVHLGICSPPIKYPDYYGIDTPTKELIAAENSIEEMRDMIGVTSLFFISLEGIYKRLVMTIVIHYTLNSQIIVLLEIIR